MLSPISLKELLDVMKMMAATEQLIADFYRNCAATWEEDRDFWLATAAEEEKHVKNIEKMSRIVEAKPERFEIGRPFNQTAIRTIMTGLENHQKRLTEGQFSRNSIMIAARDIEDAVIEKAYGELVKTSDVEYLGLVKEIITDTAKHRKAIDQRFRAMKSS